jgi:hypothetical protein
VAGRQPVAEYEWILKSPPNPASASINPAGRGTSPTTTLTFKEQGVHQVQLKVYDAQGNASNATVTLTVNVLAPL